MYSQTVELYLDGHCIETEAKNEFRRLMDRFFEGDESEETVARLEFIREFIETADFPELRAGGEAFNGDPPAVVILSADGGSFIVTVKEIKKK